MERMGNKILAGVTMEETPLVSVGMPVYNRLESTRRAIECILNQTYKNLEIIRSNDASPNPEMYEMLDEYAAKDSRIVLYHQPVDLQCYGNYAFVQYVSTGEFFMYAQDDDIWDPEFIELLLETLVKNPERAFALSASKYIDADGKDWQEFRFNNQSGMRFIFGEKAPFVWMGLWRNELMRQFDYTFDEAHGKDIIIAAEVLLSYPYGYVDKMMYSKTIYHDKAMKYITSNPLCHIQMYSSMIHRIATSKYVKNKSILVVMIPLAVIATIRNYMAMLVLAIPVEHPIRGAARRVYRIFG
jgi:glycosyltransferase involved in cell wall biosynthesis